MKARVVSICERLEKTPFTLKNGVIAFVAIVLIRTLLEDITYRTKDSFFTSDLATLLHYHLFYFVAFLGLTLLIHFGSKKPLKKVTAIALLCFPIILTPPLIDLVLFKGSVGNQLTYILTDAKGLWQHFYTLYQIHTLPGMSTGVRLEFLAIFMGVFLYTYSYTSSFLRACLTTLAAHLYLLCLFALPSFLALFSATKPSEFLVSSQFGSLLANNFYHQSIHFSDFTTWQNYLSNGSLSIVLFFVAVLLLILYVSRQAPLTFNALVHNARPERLFHYSLLIVAGMLLGGTVGLNYTLHWLNVGVIFCLFVSFWCAWLYAVGYNDLVDVEADALSNKSRPLITGAMTANDMYCSNVVFLGLSLIAGYLAGSTTLFLVMVFTALYHIYSAPPLRLKRFVGINSFIIGLCGLTAFIAGFNTMAMDKGVAALPLSWMFLIVFSLTLIANVKDIKDEIGDKATGVYTILVLFGAKNGRRIISVLVTIALTLPPLLLGILSLWWLTPPFAIMALWLIRLEPFVEQRVFFLYFLYIICAGLIIFF